MNITITIKGTKEYEKRKTVYFNLKKGAKEYKFHADLLKDEDSQESLDKEKEVLFDIIQGKIKNKTFMDKHPEWIALDSQIEGLPPQFDLLKPILKKLAEE